MKDEEIRNCFPRILSYCCEISEAKSSTAARHGAQRRPTCVKYHSTSESKVRGANSSSRMVTETSSTTKKVVRKQKEAASLSERGRDTRRREMQSKVAAFVCQQSLTE